ncbi:MAG: hypothetical protein GXX80_01140 [Thermotogaceae bacterium]|nr:hypothetical protein [Thermotogaceae bacterium]
MEFRLAQIIAAIEKLDLSFNAVFMQVNDGGLQSALDAFLDLFRSDRVLNHILSLIESQPREPIESDEWLKTFGKPKGSMAGSGVYSLPNEIPNRILLTRAILSRTASEGLNFTRRFLRAWYSQGNIHEMTMYFLGDFLGSLHRDLKNMLIDMRVEAELADEKLISEARIINIIFGGNVQNVQGDMNQVDMGPPTQS